jgi:hypothetical protein
MARAARLCKYEVGRTSASSVEPARLTKDPIDIAKRLILLRQVVLLCRYARRLVRRSLLQLKVSPRLRPAQSEPWCAMVRHVYRPRSVFGNGLCGLSSVKRSDFSGASPYQGLPPYFHARKSAPHTIRPTPKVSRAESRSPRNRTEITMATTTLSLSIGATFTTSPSCKARK